MVVLNWVLYFVGILILFNSIDIGRKKDSVLEPFSKKWWFRMVLMLISLLLIVNTYPNL